jgi:poly(A) polymerase
MTHSEASRRFATEVVRRLRAAGFQSLWAGGCVRDLILGQVPADYDVATDATPDQVMAILPFHSVPVGISFGVVRVLDPKHSGVEVEVATFRSDGAYVDGRRPESVVFGSPQLDAERRDFTINGMFLDPISEELIDYVGGQEDLKRRVLRAIGDPEARLREDKLRVLRAIRLAARFHLQIESRTIAALRAMASSVVTVSAERIAQELRRMLVHRSRAKAMKLALEVSALAAILPPVARMRGQFQGNPIEPEGDLWDHTMLVLEFLPADPSFTLAFAALLHDVGKPKSVEFADERMGFPNHEQLGAKIAADLCRGLKLSVAERERVTWLVAHQRDLADARNLRESKLKQILATTGSDELLALCRADALASTGDAHDINYCEYYLRELPTGPINPPPLVTGADLVRHGLTPGPSFKRILDEIRAYQLDGKIGTQRDALEWLDRWIEQGLEGPAPP